MTVGCHKHLSAPELVDPVYMDLKGKADALLTSITAQEKEVEKARVTYETAPIRTGQKEDATEDYFQAQHKLQKMMEDYRYYALKVRSQLKNDRVSYEKAYKENKPWPDPEEIANYRVDRKIAEEPKEWNSEDRIKKKLPKKATPTEAAE
jgi:hypothetical protein